MSARFVTLCVTETEELAARAVRVAREAMVRGCGSDALVEALANPHVAILLSELADTMDVMPEEEGEL